MRVYELMSSLKNFDYDIYCGYVPELLPFSMWYSNIHYSKAKCCKFIALCLNCSMVQDWRTLLNVLPFSKNWIEMVVCLDISLKMRLRCWKEKTEKRKKKIGHFRTILQFSSGELIANVHGFSFCSHHWFGHHILYICYCDFAFVFVNRIFYSLSLSFSSCLTVFYIWIGPGVECSWI